MRCSIRTRVTFGAVRGSTVSRLGYAMSQIFITHGATGTQLNFSEICGNATAVAISNAYDPDHRTASDAVQIPRN